MNRREIERIVAELRKMYTAAIRELLLCFLEMLGKCKETVKCHVQS